MIEVPWSLEINVLCAECLQPVCACEALDAQRVIRDMRSGTPLLERAELFAQADTEWQVYRERCRVAIDVRRRVEVIRDPRLT